MLEPVWQGGKGLRAVDRSYLVHLRDSVVLCRGRGGGGAPQDPAILQDKGPEITHALTSNIPSPQASLALHMLMEIPASVHLASMSCHHATSVSRGWKGGFRRSGLSTSLDLGVDCTGNGPGFEEKLLLGAQLYRVSTCRFRELFGVLVGHLLRKLSRIGLQSFQRPRSLGAGAEPFKATESGGFCGVLSPEQSPPFRSALGRSRSTSSPLYLIDSANGA